jgi:hypothetical protein
VKLQNNWDFQILFPLVRALKKSVVKAPGIIARQPEENSARFDDLPAKNANNTCGKASLMRPLNQVLTSK